MAKLSLSCLTQRLDSRIRLYSVGPWGKSSRRYIVETWPLGSEGRAPTHCISATKPKHRCLDAALFHSKLNDRAIIQTLLCMI